MTYNACCWHCTRPREYRVTVALLILLILVEFMPDWFSEALLVALLAVPVLWANFAPALGRAFPLIERTAR